MLMETKYIIAMINVPRKEEIHTLPLILDNKNDPVSFDSLEKAIETTRLYNQWHPETNFEVKKYYGRCKYVFEIMSYGTWKISEETLFKI